MLSAGACYPDDSNKSTVRRRILRSIRRLVILKM
uniref:Uncharacterized protein n=1 Tax=Microplitis mediator bracovirus TaxID=1836595 RepID=A0A2I6SGW1_9VIRU|nr:hypothetical protein MmBV_CMP17 [Microplitis mediator bracovirus]